MEASIIDMKTKLEALEAEMAAQQDTINKLTGQVELSKQFIYHIANNLKTPLTNIIGFSKLLCAGEYGKLKEDQQDRMEDVRDEAVRLMDMVAQIQDAIRLDSNKMKLELTDVHLGELCLSPGIRLLEERAKVKGLHFSWEVVNGAEIPAVKADYGKVTEIFINLIGNAIQFTEKGSVTVSIRTKESREGKPRSVECSVIDTGIGITEEGRHRLFREFYTGRETKGGIGLGLAITKKLVMLHGGKIGYEPREGGGSRFWFTIPIRRRTLDDGKVRS